jgi:hypothetical protein
MREELMGILASLKLDEPNQCPAFRSAFAFLDQRYEAKVFATNLLTKTQTALDHLFASAEGRQSAASQNVEPVLSIGLYGDCLDHDGVPITGEYAIMSPEAMDQIRQTPGNQTTPAQAFAVMSTDLSKGTAHSSLYGRVRVISYVSQMIHRVRIFFELDSRDQQSIRIKGMVDAVMLDYEKSFQAPPNTDVPLGEDSKVISQACPK